MKGEVFRTFLIISLIISMIAVAGLGGAPPEPEIAVDPKRVENIWPDKTFTINITVADITENESLYGLDFGISFNSSIINATSIMEGPFLKTAGGTLFSSYKNNEEFPNNKTGVVGGSNILLGYPTTGAYGSGILANITFEVLAEGNTPLHFYGSELRHWNGTFPPVPIEHMSFDGFFTNLHDIAILDDGVVPSPDAVEAGELVNVNVTVENRGDFDETFEVALYYDSVHIDTQPDALGVGATTTLEFTWDTTGVTEGDYTLTASATVLKSTENPEGADANPKNNEGNCTVKVKPPGAPVARFTCPPESVVYQLVTFDASTSTPDGGTIVSYAWDFGDNTAEIYKDENLTAIATHNYTAARDYNVTLTVTDSDSQTDSTKKSITIQKQSSTISISASPTTVPVDGSTILSGSIDPKREGVDVTIQWNQTERTWKPLVTVPTDENGQYSYLWYPPTKTYLVNASWEGDENTFGAASDLITIKVLPPPDASFIISPSEGVITYQTVSFDAEPSSTGKGRTIVSYAWDFGDGTTEIYEKDVNLTSNAFHTYTAGGTYNVTLTVIDSEGLSGTETQQLTVLQRPTATFTYSPQPPPVGETITFDASESYDDGEIVSYEWDFGDNTTEIYVKDVNLTATATHIYAETGNYTVRLTVTDNDDLTHTAEESILVTAASSNIVLYVAAVAAIIIMAATVAVYFLRVRKTKPKPRKFGQPKNES